MWRAIERLREPEGARESQNEPERVGPESTDFRFFGLVGFVKVKSQFPEIFRSPGQFWPALRLALRLSLAHSGPLWLSVTHCLAHSGSLWLALQLSLAPSGSLRLPLAYKALARLTRPLLGSERRS